MTDEERYKLNKAIDTRLLIGTFVVLAFGLLSLYSEIPVFSFISITFVDLYLFSLLMVAAIRADKIKNTYGSVIIANFLFPSRRVGVIIIPLLFLSLVFSFAGLFLSIDYCDEFSKQINWASDAFYLSVITITTVGYGDITPLSEDAKMLIISEIFSGALLLFGVFPLLISRISDFSNEDGS